MFFMQNSKGFKDYLGVMFKDKSNFRWASAALDA